jgi:hypothetical protein
MELSEGHLEDLRNHYQDGYDMGRIDERERIKTLVGLDLLLPDNVKERVKDLINGGKEYGN